MYAMAEKVKKYIKDFHAKYNQSIQQAVEKVKKRCKMENRILKMDRDWFESIIDGMREDNGRSEPAM